MSKFGEIWTLWYLVMIHRHACDSIRRWILTVWLAALQPSRYLFRALRIHTLSDRAMYGKEALKDHLRFIRNWLAVGFHINHRPYESKYEFKTKWYVGFLPNYYSLWRTYWAPILFSWRFWMRNSIPWWSAINIYMGGLHQPFVIFGSRIATLHYNEPARSVQFISHSIAHAY